MKAFQCIYKNYQKTSKMFVKNGKDRRRHVKIKNTKDTNDTSTESTENTGSHVHKRDDFICSTGHNAHLQEDFIKDQSILLGRKLPPSSPRRRLKHVSSEKQLSKKSNVQSQDSLSVRSVPNDHILSTVTEECPNVASENLQLVQRANDVSKQSSIRSDLDYSSKQDGKCDGLSRFKSVEVSPENRLRSFSMTTAENNSEYLNHNQGFNTLPNGCASNYLDHSNTVDLTDNKRIVRMSKVSRSSMIRSSSLDQPSKIVSVGNKVHPSVVQGSVVQSLVRKSSSFKKHSLHRQGSITRPLKLPEGHDVPGIGDSKLFQRQSLTHADQERSADATEPTAYLKREESIHPIETSEMLEPECVPDLVMPLLVNGRFQNPWPTWSRPGFSGLLKWRLTTSDNSKVPSTEILDKTLPVRPLKTDELTIPAVGIRVTWLGHSTTLVQFDGISLLTDPIFSMRASPSQYLGPKRYREPPGTVLDLPVIDAVLISHTHYDHLDYSSVQLLNARFGADLHWFVPFGLKEWMNMAGCVSVTELTWWQDGRIPGKNDISFIFTPAQHWSKRTLRDDNKVLWGSWCVLGSRHRFFFAGDTGYCEGFRQIGQVHGPFDLAAIPIGAYDPRWFMGPQHIDPVEAVKIHCDVKAYRSIGIHWGTFTLTNEHYLEPPEKLKEASQASNLQDDEFFVLGHGESKVIGES